MPFTTGSTPFGLFDTDTQFAADADKVLTYVARKLGESHVQVELSSSDVYTAFEEATIEYSAMVNSYQAKSVLSSFLGTPTGSLAGEQNKYPQYSLEWQRRMAQAYSDEADVGGTRPLYSASISLTAGQQNYNLNALVNVTGSDGNMQRLIVKDIFHFAPLSAYRMWGTTSAINYLNNQFSFESYTPETIFYLLPIWEDVLRSMQFETSNRVRRSNYSFAVDNNVLRLFPAPQADNTLYFTYKLASDSLYGKMYNASGSLVTDTSANGVANVSNIPFGNIEYSKLNSISKTWIWKMTLAISKEIMGHIRRKMSTIPIPNGDLTLDGSDLINDAKKEIDDLRNELKDLLDSTTYDKLAAKESEQAESLNRAMTRVPLLIYTG